MSEKIKNVSRATKIIQALEKRYVSSGKKLDGKKKRVWLKVSDLRKMLNKGLIKEIPKEDAKKFEISDGGKVVKVKVKSTNFGKVGSKQSFLIVKD
jgi:hypothetical protein